MQENNDNYKILTAFVKSETLEGINKIVNSGVRSRSEIVELFLEYGIKHFGAVVKDKMNLE